MRNSLLLFTLLLIPGLALSQASWVDEGGWPDDTTFTVPMHGVAVDPDGKVWLTPFFNSAWIDPVSGDSVRGTDGNPLFTRAIWVYNADGTPAMAPIRTITVDGRTDTLTSSARGLRADNNGNILHVDGSGNMWRINYVTGEGMNWALVADDTSVGQPAVADDGTIFTGNVLQDFPIKMWDTDFNFLGNAVDTARGFSRGFEVSGDGNTIYWGGFTNAELHVYRRDDEFSAFGIPDTMYRGIWAESFTRDPNGMVWISNDYRAGESGTMWAEPRTFLAWFATDPAAGKTDAFVDSFQLVLESPSDPVTEKARGLAFTSDGMTAYAVLWDANTSGNDPLQASVKKLVKKEATAIEREGLGIPTSFELSQSYPNPFNPTATINFKLTEPGTALLTVYDAYGRKVGTLVDEKLAAGSYNATFDARDLASGTYFYHLQFNGQRLSRKMTLLK